MCLYIDTAKHNKFLGKIIKPLIAEEDITCYKTLLVSMKSKHWAYAYELGRKESMLMAASVFDTVEYAFHSYDNLVSLRRDSLDVGIIVECIIPKGSCYYKGYHTDPLVSGYASNQIVPVQILAPLNPNSYVVPPPYSNFDYLEYPQYFVPQDCNAIPILKYIDLLKENFSCASAS